MKITIINQVMILTLLMSVGILLKKVKIITEEVNKGLSNILLNVTLPCLILNSFNMKFSPEMMKNAAIILLLAIAIHIFFIFFSRISLFKLDKTKLNTYKFATVFSNCGFMGYPLAESLYGEVGVFYTAIFNVVFNLFIYSYGVLLFTGKGNIKQSLKNLATPATFCIPIGLILFIFSIKLPMPLSSTIDTIGSMTTPISMFVIGAMLADIDIKKVLSKYDIYYINIVKLIFYPLIIMFILNLIGVDRTILEICVLLVAMPSPALLGVFSEKYNSPDKESASACVFSTTVFSIITIPFVFFIMGFI